jgi:hypothetical protein
LEQHQGENVIKNMNNMSNFKSSVLNISFLTATRVYKTQYPRGLGLKELFACCSWGL